VVLPVKGGSGAKSRLGGGPGLATAIAQDCLDAVLSCPAVRIVLVVSADRRTLRWATAAGATAVAESTPGAGLRSAVQDGLDRAAAEGRGPVAVLLGDLPALRAADLTDALAAAWRVLTGGGRTRPRMAFVPDAEGSGTVLLSAANAEAMDPAFGAGSADEHARLGAVRLDLPLPRLRRDVDVAADLSTALLLGCGPRTAAVLERAAGAGPVRRTGTGEIAG
jgi:2-phospho-L-lactate guanylyltransferase